jgi:hypothetical protein
MYYKGSTMNRSVLKAALAGSILSVSSFANAGLIGVWGGGFSTWDSYLANSGHTAVDIDSSSTLAELSLLDQVWLIRQDGDSDLLDYVANGGTLVTEWRASTWAITNNAMLDATVTQYAYVNSNETISFTAQGQALGLGDALGSSYSNGGSTQFFEEFTNIGSEVDIVATFNGGRIAGISGMYGAGNVLSLGWDWQDVGTSNSITQSLVNDISGVSFRSTSVPEPSTLAIFALGIMGLASRRFKKQ